MTHFALLQTDIAFCQPEVNFARVRELFARAMEQAPDVEPARHHQHRRHRPHPAGVGAARPGPGGLFLQFFGGVDALVCLFVALHSSASFSMSRRRARPRLSWDLTVPSGSSRVSAISATDRPSK